MTSVNVDGRVLTLTNLDKELFPHGFTKAEVIDYYQRIFPVISPHLAGKVVTRIRFPHGVGHGDFFEKNPPSGAPAWLATQATQGDELTHYVLVNDLSTLLYLANLASLEFHVPQWIIADNNVDDGLLFVNDDTRSRRLVIDLDPGMGTDVGTLVRVALLCAGELVADGLLPLFCMSGSKGLHLYAAHAPTPAGQVLAYVHDVAKRVQALDDAAVLAMSKQAREGKVMIDFRQNQASRSMVCPYSLRGREHASVATPVTLDELAGARSIDDLRFGPADVLARLERDGDLLAELLEPTEVALPSPA